MTNSFDDLMCPAVSIEFSCVLSSFRKFVGSFSSLIDCLRGFEEDFHQMETRRFLLVLLNISIFHQTFHHLPRNQPQFFYHLHISFLFSTQRYTSLELLTDLNSICHSLNPYAVQPSISNLTLLIFVSLIPSLLFSHQIPRFFHLIDIKAP
jgi:hypothetical protein